MLHGKGAQPPIESIQLLLNWVVETKQSAHLLNSSRLSPFALTILSATTGNFWHSFRMRGDAIRPIDGRHRPAGRSSQPISWLMGWLDRKRQKSVRAEYVSARVERASHKKVRTYETSFLLNSNRLGLRCKDYTFGEKKGTLRAVYLGLSGNKKRLIVRQPIQGLHLTIKTLTTKRKGCLGDNFEQ